MFGDWRALILCRRMSLREGWPFPDPAEVEKALRHMNARGLIANIPGVTGVRTVTVPFANLLPVSEDAILHEAAPACVISHRSAMARHRLTTWIPNEIFVTRYDSPGGGRLPFGTTPDDWAGIPFPRGTKPTSLNGTKVRWMQSAGKWDFGSEIGWADGLPSYQTDLERTLLDILRNPDKGGGIAETLDAWEQGLERANIDRLIEHTERFESPIVRQRVGFLMEAFGIGHEHLEQWRSRLQRGGSLKLLADAPYSLHFSPRWNLSLNLPDSLRERFSPAETTND